MRFRKSCHIDQNFYNRCLNWLESFHVFSVLDSAGYYSMKSDFPDSYHTFEKIIAVDSISELTVKNNDSFESLKLYHEQVKDWVFGYLSYDLKNELEDLVSRNPDFLNWPAIHFFQPKYIFILQADRVEVLYLPGISDEAEIDGIIDKILVYPVVKPTESPELHVTNRFSKEAYLESVKGLICHIENGDIYEINFCQEFYAGAVIDPFRVFLDLTGVSPMPFSCFYKLDHNYLVCASPERYLRKSGSKIISQPIKGTARRGVSDDEDQKITRDLVSDKKERAENIMVVDLVRNDLSRTASKASVQVEELCGLYTFPQVHQLISTVVSELREGMHFSDVLKTTFPMGSMTGMPKISAMKLIEKTEKTKRGLYSGAVGYITPYGDFDFNVVIRGIQYNQDTKYLSFSVGGAITALSDPEKEYEECLVKADAIVKVLNCKR